MLICSVFLYMSYPNFLHHLTQCQKPSFQSGLVETIFFCYSFLSLVYTARFYWDPSFFFFSWSFLFSITSAKSLLWTFIIPYVALQLLQHSLCKCHRDTCSPPLQKTKPKQKIHQVLNSNSTFIFLMLPLLTSDFRAGFHVALYPI